MNGIPSVGFNSWLPNFEFLDKQIEINEVALRKALSTIVKFNVNPPTDEGDFCNFPLATAQFALFPANNWTVFGTPLWGPNSASLVPVLGPLKTSTTPGLPVYIEGICPND